MGLVHDKQIIIEPQGFITPSNTIRNLAAEFIEHGARLYDMFDRYDSVITYILNRDNVGNSSDAGKLIAPFLKASEAGDYNVSKYYRENLPVMPGAAEAMEYFLNTLPTFIDTRMYEHAAYALCEAINVPISIVNASSLELDSTSMSRQTARELRKTAADLAKVKISKTQYELNVPVELDEDEVNMISALDEVFLRKLQKSEAGELMQNTNMVGSNEKAYALLDIRKGTQVDLDGTAYVGGEQFAGEEAIWHDGVTVYAMNYLGRVLSDSFSGNFLKEALRKADRKMPYRGPEYYQAGEYTYRCKVTGDYTWFQGLEEIYKGDLKVYECVFHGSGALR